MVMLNRLLIGFERKRKKPREKIPEMKLTRAIIYQKEKKKKKKLRKTIGKLHLFYLQRKCNINQAI